MGVRRHRLVRRLADGQVRAVIRRGEHLLACRSRLLGRCQSLRERRSVRRAAVPIRTALGRTLWSARSARRRVRQCRCRLPRVRLAPVHRGIVASCGCILLDACRAVRTRLWPAQPVGSGGNRRGSPRPTTTSGRDGTRQDLPNPRCASTRLAAIPRGYRDVCRDLAARADSMDLVGAAARDDARVACRPTRPDPISLALSDRARIHRVGPTVEQSAWSLHRDAGAVLGRARRIRSSPRTWCHRASSSRLI